MIAKVRQRIDAAAVDKHRAGAALAVVATFFRAEETEVFAKRVEKSYAGLDA
jgi:uncharacterized protein YdaU (DUF1376 family)